jgi:hypothetical protein
MRIIIVGPLEFDDWPCVRDNLDRLTKRLKTVELVTDARPGLEYHVNPSSFPVAEQWLTYRWRRSAAAGFPERFCKTNRHFADEVTWDVKGQRLEMVSNADALIAFWDSGNVDEHVAELAKLAAFYDLKVRKVLV